MAALGPMLMLVGHSILVGFTYNYFTVPMIPADVPNYFYIPWTLLGIWFVFNIFFNWHMCSFSSAGNPPKARENSPFKTCKKCDRIRPPRTHHCSVCGVCVLAMDHHCPWMNNCIGFYNYKYFYLFLFYTFTGLIYNIGTCAMFYPVTTYMLPEYITGADLATRRHLRSELPRAIIVQVVLSSSVLIAVSMLFFWHSYLAGTGQTTIEYYEYRLRQGNSKKFNDFDLGRAKNWANIFGESKYPLGWAFPSLQPPKGDGMHWPTVKTAFNDLV